VGGDRTIVNGWGACAKWFGGANPSVVRGFDAVYSKSVLAKN